MISFEKRVSSFEFLGQCLLHFADKLPGTVPLDIPTTLLEEATMLASQENRWFTQENIRLALRSLGMMLKRDALHWWLKSYGEPKVPGYSRNVGVIMAGNIPAVGFHDFLCVLISGHRIIARLSSDDGRLLPAMGEILCFYEPLWRDQIVFIRGRLEPFDAVIATGSNSSATHFEYYFRKVPHIIRHNRNGVAVLTGNETAETLDRLADDILMHFGMGCRSVSKIYVPEGYDFSGLTKALGRFAFLMDHQKYANNYEYQRALFMIEGTPVIDTGFLLLTRNVSIQSAPGVLHFEHYRSVGDVIRVVEALADQIQCVVSLAGLPLKTVQPGDAQYPRVDDYADGADTMAFLAKL